MLERPHGRSRRTVLTALGAGLVSLAGCSGPLTFAADPIALPSRAAGRLGYADVTSETVTVEREVSAGTATVSNEYAYYSVSGDDDSAGKLHLGLVASPAPEFEGRQYNPLASEPLEAVVGRNDVLELLVELGAYDDADEPSWARRPAALDPVGDGPAPTAPVTMLGTETTLRTFGGLIEYADGRDALLIHAARVEHRGDVVIAAAVRKTAVPAAYDGPLVAPAPPQDDVVVENVRLTPTGDGDLAVEVVDDAGEVDVRGLGPAVDDALLADLEGGGLAQLLSDFDGVFDPTTAFGAVDPLATGLGAAERTRPTVPAPPPSVEVAGLRLVQTSEQNRVTTSPSVGLDDPDLAAGDWTTAIFEPRVAGSASPAALPPQVTCTVALERDGGPTRYHRTLLDPQDVAEFAKSGTEDVATWGRLTGGNVPSDDGRTDALPVFRLPDDVSAVRVFVSTFVGHPLGGKTLTPTFARIGDQPSVGSSGFVVRKPKTLNICLFQVRDPDGGSNYGPANNGLPLQPRTYARNVFQLLRATFPGPVALFYVGGAAVRGVEEGTTTRDGRVKLTGPGVDAHNVAKVGRRGRFNASLYMSTDAVIDLKGGKVNFDVSTYQAAGNQNGGPDYYDYHDISAGGLTYTNSITAPSAEAHAGNASLAFGTAQVLSHEVQHFFVNDAYARSGSPWPLAQRRHPNEDRIADKSVGRDGTWFVQPDHARTKGPFTYSGFNVTDTPGVELIGYDLRDGGFRVVTTTQRASTQPGGTLTYDTIGQTAPRVESTMSYGGASWMDARMRQALLEGLYAPRLGGYPSGVHLASRTQDAPGGPASAAPDATYKLVGMITADDGAVAVHHLDLLHSVPPGPMAEGEMEVALRNEATDETRARRLVPSTSLVAPGDDGYDHESGAVSHGRERVPLAPLALGAPSGVTNLRVDHPDETLELPLASTMLRDLFRRVPDELVIDDALDERVAALADEAAKRATEGDAEGVRAVVGEARQYAERAVDDGPLTAPAGRNSERDELEVLGVVDREWLRTQLARLRSVHA